MGMKIAKVITYILLALVLPSNIFASTPSYSLRPGTGLVVINSSFVIDVLINSEEEVMLARAAITYDPEYLEVIKAERNDSLFCEYPSDEQTVDKEEGLIMITGFCQSGTDKMYKTVGDPDVFARITFKALKLGDTELLWEYSGEDEPFKSVMMIDGSPTQNILENAPFDGSYEIVKSVSDIPDVPEVPDTGIGISAVMAIAGVMLIVSGIMYTRVIEKRRVSKLKTVVRYD